MFTSIAKAPTRHVFSSRKSFAAFVSGLALVLMLGATVVNAGPGHDHGPAAPAAGAAPSPRVVANSDTYQFVGIVEGEVLVIYLDRFPTNAPVTNAKIEVTIGDVVAVAEPQPKGTYEVSSKLLKKPGDHAVIASVTEGQTTDLLVGTVTISDPAKASGNGPDHSIWSHVTASPKKLAGYAGGAGLLLLGAMGLSRGRRRIATLALLVAGLGLVGASAAFAHEGHDHGPATGGNGDAPQRLPDGTIFLPKPTQRLLEVRTRVLVEETAPRTVRFQGRVIANPNKSGVVQGTIQGRFLPAPGGVPAIGTRVKVGDILGRIAPSFASKEASDVSQALGDLDQQISITRSKLNRQEQLLRTNVVARAAVDEIRLQLDGLEKRRKELIESRSQPEELRAPVDGVITAVRVVAGQVVAPSDQIFQIVDPSNLMIEALMFDQAHGGSPGDATAVYGENRSAKLTFLGRSRSLQQQYTVLKFEVAEASDDLNVGTPVVVVARVGAPVTGLRVPRAAIAQAPNGQTVVFLHKEAEIFEARAVRTEPFDAETVLVVGGVAVGDKVVVDGAPVVNQVR